MDAAEFGKVLRQGAERRYLQIPAPVGAKLQIQNAHLYHVTGLGPLDVDRAGQEMRAGAAECALQHLLMSGNDTEAERRIRHIVGSPDKVSIVTRSPDAIRSTGFNRPSQSPQCTLPGVDRR
jgi:hypothetical protein